METAPLTDLNGSGAMPSTTKAVGMAPVDYRTDPTQRTLLLAAMTDFFDHNL